MTWNVFFVFICVHYNRRIDLSAGTITMSGSCLSCFRAILSPRVRLSLFCADLLDDTMRCLSVIFSSILTFLRFCKAGSTLAMNWYLSFQEWSEAKFNPFESTDNMVIWEFFGRQVFYNICIGGSESIIMQIFVFIDQALLFLFKFPTKFILSSNR